MQTGQGECCQHAFATPSDDGRMMLNWRIDIENHQGVMKLYLRDLELRVVLKRPIEVVQAEGPPMVVIIIYVFGLIYIMREHYNSDKSSNMICMVVPPQKEEISFYLHRCFRNFCTR